jgi:hypothetical protein
MSKSKQRTFRGAYSAAGVGAKGSGDKDSIRNVDIGPAQGVVRNPYATKTFEHLDKQSPGSWDAYLAGFNDPVPKSAGKVVKQGEPVESRQDLSGKFDRKPRKRWE